MTTTKLEYIIWGKCPKLTKHNDEVILYTQASSYKHAEYVMTQLQIQHQCTETRIQILNPKEKPDFIKTICFK
tara:strand:+ start:254 stop:472 length:219 start_codon:yes stop_codon:yes gene_type:complete